ncbi:hypothetical protein ASA1KI_43150 [Opitutales bacterium ASA1]|uniref:DUF6973 domain-containing protein n=1 Tax=Congregicoccus parvus TaxID=3081749 RepID=UPI002B2BE625|nr:hypothetical protein ASA1KI_43150 [Opitutales bacterium ASA1]
MRPVVVKRLLLVFVLLLGLLAGGLYAFRDIVAQRVIDRGLARLTVLAAERGVELGGMQVGSAVMPGVGTVAALGVRAEAQLARGLLHAGREGLFLEAGRVSLSLLDLRRGRVLLTIEDGTIVVLDPAGQPTGQQITKARAEVELSLAWRHLESSVLVIEEEMRRLLRDGWFNLPARISGEAQFQVLGKWQEITIGSEVDRGVTRLLLEHEDVRTIAKAYMLPLTEAEIDLVAHHPVRAPALLRFSQQAFASAEALRRKDRSYPYDAYRHVYWSWLLTREFGPEFAERVTDAHEIRPTYEVSEASRRMDLHNNAVGRAYALANVPEREIPQRVSSDPNVIVKER